MFDRNGTVVSLIAALGIAVVLILSMLLNTPGDFFDAHGTASGSFYEIIPLWAMQIAGIATFGFSLVALAMGARNFWQDAGPLDKVGPISAVIALWDVLTLKNLGGGGNGCNDNSEAFSMRRRYLHHAMFYGFLLCFAATTTGFIYHTFLGWPAPYSLISAPVVLGTVGGILMMVGTIGLLAMKFVDDPVPNVRRLLGGRPRAADAAGYDRADGSCSARSARHRSDGPGDGDPPRLHLGVLSGAAILQDGARDLPFSRAATPSCRTQHEAARWGVGAAPHPFGNCSCQVNDELAAHRKGTFVGGDEEDERLCRSQVVRV